MNSPSTAEPPQAVLEYESEESIGYWLVLTPQAYQKALKNVLFDLCQTQLDLALSADAKLVNTADNVGVGDVRELQDSETSKS